MNKEQLENLSFGTVIEVDQTEYVTLVVRDNMSGTVVTLADSDGEHHKMRLANEGVTIDAGALVPKSEIVSYGDVIEIEKDEEWAKASL